MTLSKNTESEFQKEEVELVYILTLRYVELLGGLI